MSKSKEKNYPIVYIKIRGGSFKYRDGDYVLAKKSNAFTPKPIYG
jgi:hypothetical protein